jgi:aryl-phospho-beta-D-glucosidase BglC (GH1 family)
LNANLHQHLVLPSGSDIRHKPQAMHFFSILMTATTAGLAVAAPVTQKKKRVSKMQFFGVNESGPEFGNNIFPGQLNKDYVWPTLSTIDVWRHWQKYEQSAEPFHLDIR